VLASDVMIYNRPIANGREYTSAEWLREMLCMEAEGYAPNEMLSVVSVTNVSLVAAGASSKAPALDDLQADAGCFPEGAGAEVLA